MRRFLCFVFALILNGLTFPVSAEPLKVVASFSILADITRQIGGRFVEVKSLVGPDGDAHVFEPSPADAKIVKIARVVVLNGLNFEEWAPKLLQATGTQAEIVTTTIGITPRPLNTNHDHHKHSHEEVDPHAWQNVENVKIYTKNIVEGLSKADSEHAEDYRLQGKAYLTRLDALEVRIKKSLDAIPVESRKAITSHDALGYLGDAYGIMFIAPEGARGESQPSAKDVAKLIKQIRKEKIKAIFVENMSDPRLTQQVSRETGAKIGGKLYSDALSPAEGPASTYIDMMDHNIRLIAKSLSE
ncbi:zinc/manganese transport system substrate-binding protein [Azospirillaceae bacterium]